MAISARSAHAQALTSPIEPASPTAPAAFAAAVPAAAPAVDAPGGDGPAADAPAADAPAARAPATSAVATGEAYLEPGIEAGIADELYYGALQLDGGYHLGATPLWLHARFAQGALAARFQRMSTRSSDFTEARLGLEARGCVLADHICLVGGVDFGYRHGLSAAAPASPGSSPASPGSAASATAAAVTGGLGVAIARLGLDLGGANLRFRPSIETSVHHGGWSGLALSSGIAYVW